jgi:hypothetical protein
LSGLLAGIILLLTVSTSLVLGILAGYGAVAGIIFLFARGAGRIPEVATALTPAKAMGAAASQTSGD